MTLKARRWKIAFIAGAVLLALQITASVLVHTHRVRSYLISHLEQTFGRHVEVDEFAVSLLPAPELDAEGITVSEDPGFGEEYFLRAEHFSAGVRWTGLLRGHLRLGTVTLSHPTLVLSRNSEGRWNLEGWLPPGRSGSSGNPPAEAPAANRLQKIEIDSGRLDFKLGDQKQAFAFIGVSGSVEQMGPGRWQLHLEAQPWRSGVQLQSTGTLYVDGEVAGTSARLQPASLRIHWGDASLADFFRLVQGQDRGVRGVFALDATAESGVKNDGTRQTGAWSYSLDARATQIHRWDLTERSDNPSANLHLKGLWDPALGTVSALELFVDTPKSNLRGTASLLTKPKTSLEIHIDSSGVQGSDLLAWYRAFHAGVSDKIAADLFFTGGISVSGLPFAVHSAGFSSFGGTVTVPDLADPIRVGAVRGGIERRRFVVEPVSLLFGAEEKYRNNLSPGKKATSVPNVRPAASSDQILVSMMDDLDTRIGAITFAGRIGEASDVLKVASDFGRPLNHGWDLTGPAQAAVLWGWGQPTGQGWSGQIAFSGAKLQAAGLNRPLDLQDVKLQWQEGKRSVQIATAKGFGAIWTGTLNEATASADSSALPWQFDLHADRLDAAELDRWAGPRARPNWLQRLMASFLGGGSSGTTASAFLKLVRARGNLQVDEFDLEQVKLRHLRATLALRNLDLQVDDAQAQWAGGTLRGSFSAAFSAQPKYTASADFERVNLGEIPFAGRAAERVSGQASGSLTLQTAGVGHDALLANLEGQGQVRFGNLEFRGWDVPASLATGAMRVGSSRWNGGDARFRIADQSFIVTLLRLNGPQVPVLLRGSVSFKREADLQLEAASEENRKQRAAADHVLNLAGPLDRLRVKLAVREAQQPGD